ncbi:thioesterase [Advenella kashmirensis W13003]|uniref:Thioesterase n=1 Tax=Advenella kashmirensis W13003 TaxID=1424334 RepID=V8QPJ2_9BURK|nr:thioesterase [Advenella kashmirensis W13003]
MFSTVIPTRWSDMDADGRVNNLVILRFAEEARMQWAASLELAQIAPDLMPVVATVGADFLSPIPYPCDLIVDIRSRRLGNSSLDLGFDIADSVSTGRLYARACATWVWLDKRTSRPAPMPQSLREHCESFMTHAD